MGRVPEGLSLPGWQVCAFFFFLHFQQISSDCSSEYEVPKSLKRQEFHNEKIRKVQRSFAVCDKLAGLNIGLLKFVFPETLNGNLHFWNNRLGNEYD